MTAALILAAGRGTRFGGGKMLAEIDGRPMLQHVLDTAAEAGLEPVVVVLGADADEVAAAIEWRTERRVLNEDPDRGLSSSLKLGLAALQDAERVLVMLGDQPRVSNDQIAIITAVERDPSKPIVVPRYGSGTPGNPVLLEREAWPLAGNLVGDTGMSQLFDSHVNRIRNVDVPGTNPDLDTPAQLKAAQGPSIVSAGYDSLGDRYERWRAHVSDPLRDRLLAEFVGRIIKGSPVLELGCGPGTGATSTLAQSFELTGVDMSPVQLAKAQVAVPGGRFILSDMTTIDFPQASFDGVVAFYSLIHVPNHKQPALLTKVRRWLRPGGLLLATFSAKGGGDWSGDWLGVPMFFSGFYSAENRTMLTRAGFEMLVDEEADALEPEGPVRFQWILARANPA